MLLEIEGNEWRYCVDVLCGFGFGWFINGDGYYYVGGNMIGLEMVKVGLWE